MAPEDPYIQNSLGLAYMGKERNDIAINAFGKALSLKPDYTEALNNLGAAYLRDEKFDIAIQTFNKVLEDMTYPTPHYPLGQYWVDTPGTEQLPGCSKLFFQSIKGSAGIYSRHPWTCTTIYTHGTGRQGSGVSEQTDKKGPETAIFHKDLAQAYEACGKPGRPSKPGR